MKWLFAALPFLIASPLLIASAIWQGKETERWGEIPEMKQFAARLDKLPLKIGPWIGKRGPGLTESSRKAAGAEGDLQIIYTNQETGQQVDMFIVCGRLLDMSKHRPDRCYPAQGYKAVGDEAVLQKFTTADNSTVEFRTALYSKEDQGLNTRIYWSWASEGGWKAPDGEDGLRKVFRRTKPMFKLYVDNQAHGGEDRSAQEPSVDLIQALIPVYNKILFPSTDKASDETATPAQPGPPKAAVQAKSVIGGRRGAV